MKKETTIKISLICSGLFLIILTCLSGIGHQLANSSGISTFWWPGVVGVVSLATGIYAVKTGKHPKWLAVVFCISLAVSEIFVALFGGWIISFGGVKPLSLLLPTLASFVVSPLAGIPVALGAGIAALQNLPMYLDIAEYIVMTSLGSFASISMFAVALSSLFRKTKLSIILGSVCAILLYFSISAVFNVAAASILEGELVDKFWTFPLVLIVSISLYIFSLKKTGIIKRHDSTLPPLEFSPVGCACSSPKEQGRVSAIQEQAIIDDEGTHAADNENTSSHESHENKHEYCRRCGATIDRKTGKCSGCGKHYTRLKHLLLSILAILFLISLFGNVSQFMRAQADAEKIDAQKSRIEKLEGNVASLNKTVAEQRTKIADLEIDSQYFEFIRNELSSGNIGYAAEHFRASESVIVVDKETTNRKFILTAHWNNYGTVSIDYEGVAALVTFDKNSWSTSTTMTVNPWKVGVTSVTFSNDVDAHTFKVLIIVTD